MKAPLISIVLATKNEEPNIERLLKSLIAQTLPRKQWEVILIDNNSRDGTRKIAKKFVSRVYNLIDIIDAKTVKNHRGTQLNCGVRRTNGPIVFFPDTDMTFDKGLLKEAVRVFEHRDVDALYVPEIVIGRGFFGKIRNFERSFYDMTSIDAVRIVRRNLYLAVGGFDEKKIEFGPDDWDFSLKIKGKTNKISITKNKIFHHEENISIITYLRKKWMYTEAFNPYLKKWGTDNPDVKQQFSVLYRYAMVFLEKGKWKKLLSHPILTAGMFFLRFCVGIVLLTRKFLAKKI